MLNIKPHLFRAALAILLLVAGTATATSFNPAKLLAIDAAVLQAIADQKLPGGVVWIEHDGKEYTKAYGHRALLPAPETMTKDTVFDAASLTKVMAGAPAAMLLVERGQLDLDAPVQKYLPEFQGGGKEAVTVRHLLTHVSGLRPGISHNPPWSGYDAAIKLACGEKLVSPPGAVCRYSDINLFVLGEVVRRVSGQTLDVFCAKEIYRPLKMDDTGFLPAASKRARTAPTEKADGQFLRGVVHDPTARRMGGVAGHAGLFTTAADLAKFARMMLHEGSLKGVRIFKPETVRLMTSVQTPPDLNERRGLGWDIDTGYSGPRGKRFPLGSYGHTGWTGGSVWIDPFSKSFVIFLSNRNHPDGSGNVLPLRAELGTLAAEAIRGFDFAQVPGALPPRVKPPTTSRPVLNGIDVLKRQKFEKLKGLKIGLVTNHTGQDRERNATIDLLKEAPGVQLKVLFGPEHGLRGAADEKFGDSTDEKTGLPIYSLYGKNNKPTKEQLQGLDALVFDIQDLGARFYTYSSTMGLCMEAAAEAGLRYFVLDRVCPVRGDIVQGPVLTSEPNFVHYYYEPVRYGLTLGELAQMYKAEKGLKVELTVIPCENWTRDLWYDQTGLPWINPSPNMRSLNAATLYTGVCLLESTSVSMGRGTGMPFEIMGAPYIDDVQFAWEMNQAGIPGVSFVPIRFTPDSYLFKGQDCGGVYMVLTDRNRCEAVDIGIVAAKVLHRLYPKEFTIDKMKNLLGHDATLAAIKAGKSLAEIKALWAPDFEKYLKRREPFLLYK